MNAPARSLHRLVSAGRPAQITQDGWQVAYAYADAAATRASRLTLRYQGSDPVELRIVVDRWQ